MPTCALCQHDRELRDSHIVPKFVFDYLKRTSATGFLRFSNQPNRRVQDGRKLPLLCGECEQRLSDVEKYFAETVFQPYSDDRSVTIHYDGRLLKFAASLSWRVLYYYNVHGHLDEVPAPHVPRIDAALEVWRRYLLDELPHPGHFEHHLLPMDELESSTVPSMPTGINRYVLRSVDTDVVTSEKTALVYTKLPRIAIVGFVHMPLPRNRWQGTRIAAGRGTIMPRQFVIPQNFGEYMMDKARIGQEALASMSDRQKDIVNEATLKNLDRAAASESIRAMAADVRLFGRAAFSDVEVEGDK